MAQTQHYFFVIEFYVANEFGMAITTADNKRSAAEFLKNEGKYNSAPELYEIKSIRNVGKYFGNCIGLLLEHYGEAGSITKEDVINALGYTPVSPFDYLILDCGTEAE